MIRLENVKKSFGNQVILEDYNLHVKKGETFVVLGRSGIGKSVTLKHIVGILQPDEGKIFVDGEDITHADVPTLYRVRRKVAYLFQSGALINWMTVGGNVELPIREHTNLPLTRVREIAKEKLRHVEMLDAYDKYPAEISGGMRKRVALARVLAQDPKIILYDEPTAGLDPIMTNNITHLIRNAQTEFGVTSIVVTHHLECAYFVGNRIGMHHGKRIEVTGTPDEIKNSTHPVVRAFLRGEAIDGDGLNNERG